MVAHAEELEKSYFQLTGFIAQEILGSPAVGGEVVELQASISGWKNG